MTDEALPVPADEQEDTFLRNLHRLFFRPSSYFSGIRRPKKYIWLYIFAFTCGMAYAINRIEIRLFQGMSPPETWTVYWTIIGIYAFVGIFIILKFGSAWYAFRLRLCGVQTQDKTLVRMVYLSAAQIYALPTIAVALISSINRMNPIAAAIGQPAWIGWAVLIFPLWSYWASYVGAMTVFRAKRFAALAWFLVLPCAFIAIVFVLSYWLAASGSPVFSGPAADVDHPREFADGNMSFSYPGNWRITKNEKTSDLESNVQVQPVQDAIVQLKFFKPVSSMEGHLQGGIAAMLEENGGLAEAGAFDRWGSLSGVGRRLEGRILDKPFKAWLFIAPLSDDQALFVIEMAPESAMDKIQPGFELVRKTFRPLR
jgi:hypothetical protein